MKYRKTQTRNNSVNIPLYKKLEENFEKNYILPKINENKKKLEEHKKLKGRHESLQELKNHQIEHNKILQRRLKELVQERNYKQKYQKIKVPKSPWIENVIANDLLKKEKAMQSINSTGRINTYKNLEAKLKFGKITQKLKYKEKIKGNSKNTVYKIAKINGKTMLNKKSEDINSIIEVKDESEEYFTQNNKDHEDSGAVYVENKGIKTAKVTPVNKLALPPWNSPIEKLNFGKEKPPKAPLKIPIPKIKKSRNKTKTQSSKFSSQGKTENKMKSKSKTRDFLKEMREKRKGKR